MDEVKDNDRAEQRQRYQKLCSVRIDKRLEELDTEIAEQRNQVRMLQEQLVKAIRDERILQEKKDIFKDSQKEHIEAYRYEYDKLCSFTKVREVKVGNDAIHVFTDILYVLDPTDGRAIMRELGRFEICLFYNENYIRIINLDRRINGYKDRMNAPHVFSRGKCCWGTMEEPIVTALKSAEYIIVIQLAILFLESVNIKDDAGEYVINWPAVEDKQLAESLLKERTLK